jgi:hypothetical protein
MCLLITLTGVDPEFPILVAGNRDELRARKSAPPGLFVGARHRILSPRDRVAGGTWIGVNEAGLFAGLTNLAGVPRREGTTSRGSLPHLALDQDGIDAAVEAVRESVSARRFDGFQLLLSDGRGARVLAQAGGVIDERRFDGGAVVISNEHRVGQLVLPGLEAAAAPGLGVEERLERLRSLLLDTGERSGHRILKRGGEYGTVSSSLIAVHRGDPDGLIWRFAPGPPDETGYRSYGNLSRRLIEG